MVKVKKPVRKTILIEVETTESNANLKAMVQEVFASVETRVKQVQVNKVEGE